MKKEKLLNAIGQIDDKMIADAKPEVRAKQKRVKFSRMAVAVAACLVLLLAVGVITPIAVGNTAAGTITMEINPGVEYTITRNGKVKEVRFLNDDAEGALAKVALKGQSLDTAVALTVAAYKAAGFMESNDTVLISFDKKLSENARLKESVSENVRRALEKTKSVHTVVYAPAANSDETAAIAKKYGVSQGKAQLIADAKKNSSMSEEELANLPLDELVWLQKDIDSKIIASDYIGILKAKAIALSDSGCTTRVEFTEARLIDIGAKYPYYRIVFSDKYAQWTYLINAINGDILDKNEVALFISLEDARNIALKYAGLADNAEEKVVFTKEELSRNSGRPCWVLEFYTTEFQYFFKIDAKTGEVFFFEYHIDVRKAKEIAAKDVGVFEEFSKLTFTVEEYVGGGIKTPYFYLVFNNDKTQWTYRIDATLGHVLDKSEVALLFSLQKAREIALKDAGITDESEVTFTKEELNKGPERPCWIIEFYNEKYRYSYVIDATEGRIIYSNAEALMVSLDRAKEIALTDAEIPKGVEVVFTNEVLSRNMGRPCWVLEFYIEKYQFSYKIDAKTGEVIYNRRYINIERAKETALKDAAIEENGKVVFTVEELVDGGIKTPYFYLVFNDGQTQWTYRIDATNGGIIHKEDKALR